MKDNVALYAYLNDTLSKWYFPLLNQHITILDFGCGNGFLTNCIQNSFYNSYVIGVDNDIQQIEENKKQYPNLEFQIVNDKKMPFDNDSIDLIYAVNVFHHIDQKDRQVYTHELLRVLKPSGCLIIIEANPFNFRARSEFYKEHSQGMSMLNACKLKRLFNDGKSSVSIKYLYPSRAHQFEFLLNYLPFGSLYAVIIQKNI